MWCGTLKKKDDYFINHQFDFFDHNLQTNPSKVAFPSKIKVCKIYHKYQHVKKTLKTTSGLLTVDVLYLFMTAYF